MRRNINYKIILQVLSRILFIISISLLVCIIIAFVYSEKLYPFYISAIISALIGYLFFRLSKNHQPDEPIQRKEAYLTVTLSWLFISLISTIPYIISGAIPGFINAFFESVSGFTTTGSSILTDIESLPKSILFWRSLTHWIGGIGVIVLVIIIMPSLHIGAYHLFTLESSLQEKISPKIKSVGHRLLLIYIILTISEVILLLLGNMNLFESVCHAFGTIATGGFSPKNTSIGGYSPYIQYVVMIFMLLSGTNFVIHYHLFKKKFKQVNKNEEFKFYLGVVFIIGLIITLMLYFNMNKPFETAFRESFFQIISVLTCTGYATADYLLWPNYAWFIVFLAMFFGGSTGSTAGGIKMVRHVVLFKNFSRMIKKMVEPKAIIPLKLNGITVSDDSNNTILSFIFLYILLFIIGSVTLLLIGIDIETAASSVATCMAGIGPGIGTVGPASNFAHLPDIAKVILSILMITGRLEIYTVLVLFSRNFWRY
ncbi:MAG: TrkH family potassium uptake protein [Prolixibacteraceae bacterium]|jgi:trk system potassium uptake protein TrkH|nr:TrkH family potassium uptake protein [Prolixibacteraceae bacterium]